MELLSPQSVLFFLLFAISALYLLSRSTHHRSTTPPSFKSYPIVGHLPQFLRNRHRMLDWISNALAASPTNTLTFRRPGGVRGVITAHPANVEHILKTRFDNYPKGPRFDAALGDFLGAGIFNADGDTWRLQRKTASHEFSTRSLRSFVLRSVRQEIDTRLHRVLSRASRGAGRVVDLQDLLERFTFDNVCKVAFDHDPAYLDLDAGESSAAAASSAFTEAFKDAADLSAGRFRYAVPGLWRLKRLLGVGSERRLREAIATVHGFAVQIIRSRREGRAESARSDDLLSRFVAGGDYSEEFLRDIVISFVLAGRDTTSSGLTWFFWLLSSHPAVEERILGEIRSIRSRSSGKEEVEEGRGSTAFEFEELKEMHYLHAAITESLRLYPPVPVDSMQSREDDVFPDGTAVKRGWFVTYNSYAMGRMENIWGKDCREYKPERWLDQDGMFRPENPFRFPVFHAGPRTCLGKEMAYLQMKSIAACVLERFEIEVARRREESPRKVLSLTLRMDGGLPVRVRERRTAGM